MVRLRGAHIAIIFLIAVGIGYGGYYFYQEYRAIADGIERDRARTLEVQQNHARLTHALEDAGLSPLSVGRGFWYVYADLEGNESIAYFDLDQWSLREDLTDAEIAALAARIASSSIGDREALHSVAEADLPPELQFHNALYTSPLRAPGEYQGTLAQLEAAYNRGTASAQELWELSYMYELAGEYGKRDEVRAADCARFGERCTDELSITVAGIVADLAGNPIQGASVSVLGHPEVAPVITNEKGEYLLHLSVSTMEKLRVSAVKRNYSTGVGSTLVLSPGKDRYRIDPIVLSTPIEIVTIDTQKHTATDPNDTANEDGSFVLHATSSTYVIPPGAIVRADGSPYLGPVDVYIYEFTRETVPSSLTTLDTFDEVMGYAGNLMQTLGMPFIQFFAPDGEQLDVFRSHPMLLTYKIPGMQDMLDNYYDRPEGPLTEGQLATILAASQGDPGFPITAEWLHDKHISTFPPFWVFDHVKGTWENQGMRLLDLSGTMQTPFYTRDL